MFDGRRFFLACGCVCLFATWSEAKPPAAPASPSPSPAASPLASASATPLPTGSPGSTVPPSASDLGPEQVMLYERALSTHSETFQKSISDDAGKFESFVEKQSTAHRDFVESIYLKIAWMLTFAVTASGALITYHSRRDINTVKAEIANKYKSEIDAAVEGKVAELETQINERINLTKQATEKDFNLVAEYASVISHAAVVLNIAVATQDPKEMAAADRERAQAIDRLKNLQDKVPSHRTFNIFLARLYRARGDLTTAIEELDKVVKDRKAKKIDQGPDHAALLYNLACYRTLSAKKHRELHQETAYSNELLDTAWRDLQLCVKLCPADLAEAKDDPDLTELIGTHPSRVSWDQLMPVANPKNAGA